MRNRRYRPVGVCTLLVSLLVLPGWGQQQAPPSSAQNQGVPKDLRPLLMPPQSEMRMVTLRYTADRNTLN
ncbi:MAG: hypothetical protein IMZ67_07380, partial [Acidobacteria bacterium]|nr:hypothetical protein [Acidobacteriota bacterium]